MNAGYRILPLAPRHIAGFRAALDAVARERRFLALAEAPPLAKVRRFVLNSLRDGATHFVAIDQDTVVGWCDVRPKSQEALRHSGVLGMGVLGGYRGNGVGRQLLGATLDVALAGGLSRIELIVRADNAPAIALYHRFGFDTEGTCRQYMRVDGVWFDALLMARLA
jgi:ribosomal protein S18 acetylase RimI-like enzyme